MSEPFLVREWLKVDGGQLTPDQINEAPNRAELFAQAKVFIMEDLREALWGLAPALISEELLLKWCLEAIRDNTPDDDGKPLTEIERVINKEQCGAPLTDAERALLDAHRGRSAT